MKPANKNIDEEAATPMIYAFPILGNNDCYTCPECPCSVEILSINDGKNTLTVKCLNPIEKDNHKIRTIPISEYINSMKKFTYKCDKCSICKKQQDSSKDLQIFSYCIKCDKVICNVCIEEHLKLNASYIQKKKIPLIVLTVELIYVINAWKVENIICIEKMF